jgi:hypothetical protein
MIRNRPETLRKLKEGELPAINEVSWDTDEDIENDDQARLATAVLKRLRKAVKAGHEKAEAEYEQVAKRLETWLEKKGE